MEPIDAALERLSLLIPEVAGYEDTINSEQDTRLKVVNRMLTEVLGWPLDEVVTEERSGSGYVDYKLTVGRLARLVVEAKRDGRDLGLKSRAPGRAYKLDGPAFSTSSIKEGLDQAVRYCGQKNAELACVTNGREWVVFRGSRLGDGRDTMDGMGFVFPSLDSVHSHFRLFWDLLSFEASSEFRYRAHFQEAEGRPIRMHAFHAPLRGPDTRRFLPRNKLSGDLDRVMTSFFRRLSGDADPEVLAKCFVVTRESQNADERLARISEDLVDRIRSLNTESGEQLTELIERVKGTQRNEFVIIVGTKGSGKTTFIDRFFRHVLPSPLLSECVTARVNLADSEGDEASIATWLDRQLLETLEGAVFGGAPSFEELQGMFFDEYKRRSEGPFRHLYARDKEEFKIDFGRHIETRREERPHEYIQRLVRHIVGNRKKIPCIVFDNADHFTIEFQERVFQYARSIYESELCLIIMPITDRTSWQLSSEGALRSFENESLFLPTPPPRAVLARRIDFLEEKLAEERREPGRGYFLGRGIPLTIGDLTAFTAALQAIFLRTGTVASWIGNLANNDIRRCLEIAKNIVSSPHLEVTELLKAYYASSDIYVPRYKVKRALFRGQYNIHPVGVSNSFVRNIYALEDEVETTPLLGLRILRLLEDAQESNTGDPFVTVDQIVEYCRAMMVETNATTAWLERMLEAGLCLSYDPTLTTVDTAGKLELAPAGSQHLYWGTRDSDYAQAMLEVTPLADRDTFNQLINLASQPNSQVWRDKIRCFVNYLAAEDTKFCRVPDHEAYVAQKRLVGDLQRMATEQEQEAVGTG